MTRAAENRKLVNSRVEKARNAVATLGMWSAYDWPDEVSLDRLSEGDQMLVTTRNSSYEIVVMSPWTGDVLVRGGDFFPELTPVHLAGSSLGGSVLKLRSVNVGFRLEFATAGGRRVKTTAVCAVRVIPSSQTLASCEAH